MLFDRTQAMFGFLFSRKGPLPEVSSTELPLPRQLFRPLGEWHVSPRPGLNASDYERRKAMRELEMAFTTRATALHRHRFD